VTFHDARYACLEQINLRRVLARKNPYLFRAKDVRTAEQLVTGIMDAFLSSSEEMLFGAFLEDLAIFVSKEAFGGAKSSAEGLDLEFDRDGTHYLVSVKSGPSWGNSSQKSALKAAFRRAKTVQRMGSGRQVEAVLGICYGKTRTRFNGDYWQYTGQSFWHFISGDASLYLDLIEPVGYEARRHNDAFEHRRCCLINRLNHEFIDAFCEPSGAVNWAKLVQYNSGNLEETLTTAP
jgi:hypothetical protein